MAAHLWALDCIYTVVSNFPSILLLDERQEWGKIPGITIMPKENR